MVLKLCIVAAVLIIYTATLFFIYFHKSMEVKEKELEVEKIKAVSDQTIDLNDVNILDQIIQEAFAEYKIFELDHIEDLYINEERMSLILTDMLATVLNRISDNLRDKLALVYNKDYIEDIIFRKIEMVVLDYSISINGNYSDTKK